MTSEPSILRPDWPDLPARLKAAQTLRAGGVSRDPYHSLNLGLHVGDDAVSVTENRRRVQAALSLPEEPFWLNQVHGTDVASLPSMMAPHPAPVADAAYRQGDDRRPLCILTADCLPVLVASTDGQEIGAAHAGWRSLCGGVLENLVAHFTAPGRQLTAWLGPAIGAQAFEVGPEVRKAFVDADRDAESAFVPGAGDRWMADIYALARQRLRRLGITAVQGGELCTHTDTARLYSYRRDGVTGRMATLLW